MAKLSSKQRRHLPKSDFAEPDRSFPIPDVSHGRNALARAARKPPAEKARIDAAVHRKFPEIGKGSGKKRTPRRHAHRVRSRA